MRVLATMALWATMVACPPALAAMQTFGFGCITPQATANVIGACGAGGSQLFVDVVEQAQPDRVLFTFRNLASGTASSITDVYFDDGTLLSLASVIDGPGVDFTPQATPKNLPGANNITPAFQTTAGFSADSDAPVSPNGVNPGEWLAVLFVLQAGQTYADVLDALDLAGAAGGLRIGIHVQSFSAFGGESISLVNAPAPMAAVPLPPAAMLLAAGIAVLGWSARRRNLRAD